MKHAHQAKQENLDTRTFAFLQLRTEPPQQCLNVSTANVGRDRPGKDQFQGAL